MKLPGECSMNVKFFEVSRLPVGLDVCKLIVQSPSIYTDRCVYAHTCCNGHNLLFIIIFKCNGCIGLDVYAQNKLSFASLHCITVAFGLLGNGWCVQLSTAIFK